MLGPLQEMHADQVVRTSLGRESWQNGTDYKVECQIVSAMATAGGKICTAGVCAFGCVWQEIITTQEFPCCTR